MGVEPTYQPWEGRILPMNYTRVAGFIIAATAANSKSFFVGGKKFSNCLPMLPSEMFASQNRITKRSKRFLLAPIPEH